MAFREFSYIGVGQVYLSTAGGPLRSVGNAAELSFSFEEETKTQRNYTTPGGGNANTLSKIDSFSGSLKMVDYTAENLSLALRGSVADVVAAAVSDEAQPSWADADVLIPFDHIYDATITPVVTLANATPCVEGTDYELTPTGIITVAGGNIDANGVLVSYTKAASEVMQALVAAGAEFRVVFDGQNEAQQGKPVQIILHRVKFSPAQGLNFLGGEFAEIAVDFEVLADSTKGGGDSAYFQLAQAI